MDELDALFQQLEAVQEQQAALPNLQVRLSERMVVDVVAKLKSLGLFPDDLLHTTNGREYITTSQVKKEIKMALEQCGGRVALVDLPGLLNIDYSHSSAQADEVVKEACGSISLVNGELFSEVFFQNMAMEVNELMRTVPALEVNEIARQFAIPADQAATCVHRHLGTVIQGSLEGHTLYMPSFLSIAKALLRGTLRAASIPVSISQVLKSQPFPHSSAVTNKLAVTLVQELISEGSIKGAFRPSGLVFTPESFTRARIQAVQSFYHQNKYVEYSMVKNWGVPEPLMFLTEHCPDGLQLDSIYASPGITSELEASLTSGVPTCGFLDLRELLPHSLERQDVLKLLDCSESVRSYLQAGASLVSGVYLVSGELLKRTDAVAKKAGADLGERDLIAGTRSFPVGKAEAATVPLGGQPGQSRKLKSRRGKEKRCTQRMSATTQGGSESDTAASQMAAVVAQAIAAVDWDSEQLPEELASAVSSSAAHVALQSYEDRIQAGLSTGSQAEHNAALQEVCALQQQAVFHLKGLRTLVDSSGAAAAEEAAEGGGTASYDAETVQRFSGCNVGEQIAILEEHLLQMLLVPAADAALRYTAVHVCGCLGIEELETLDLSQQRRMTLERLPAGLRAGAEQVVAVLEQHKHSSAAMETLLGAVDTLLSSTGAELLSREREAEQQFVEAGCELNRQLLRQPGAALVSALSASIVCLVGEHFHALVLLPGRAVTFIIRCVSKFLREQDTELLEVVHREVIHSLARKPNCSEAHGAAHEALVTKLASLCHVDGT